MKSKLLSIIVLFLGGLSFLSCKKDASELFIIAKPNADVISGGNFLYFDIEAHSLNSIVQSIDITRFDGKNGLQNIESLFPGTKDVNKRIFCTLNDIVDSCDVLFTFTAKDANELTQDFYYTVTVAPSSTSSE